MQGLLGLDYGTSEDSSEPETTVNTSQDGSVVVVESAQEQSASDSLQETEVEQSWSIESSTSDSGRILRVRLIREELDAMMPPKPEAPCDPSLAARLKAFKEKVDAGLTLTINERIRASANDPHLLPALVRKQGIAEDATNYPLAHFNKDWYSDDDYFEALAARVRAGALRKEQAMTIPLVGLPTISFPQPASSLKSIVSHVREGEGTTAGASSTREKSTGSSKGKRKRTSKWDQR